MPATNCAIPEMFQLAKYDNIIVLVVELLCMDVVLVEYPCNGVHVLLYYFIECVCFSR